MKQNGAKEMTAPLVGESMSGYSRHRFCFSPRLSNCVVIHRVSHRGVLYRLVQPSKRDRDCDSDQTECTCPPCMYIYVTLYARSRPLVLSLPTRCLITWKRITLRFAAVISRDIHLLCNIRGNLPNRSFCLVNKCLIFSVGYISVMRATWPTEICN